MSRSDNLAMINLTEQICRPHLLIGLAPRHLSNANAGQGNTPSLSDVSDPQIPGRPLTRSHLGRLGEKQICRVQINPGYTVSANVTICSPKSYSKAFNSF